jgi:ribonuclease R
LTTPKSSSATPGNQAGKPQSFAINLAVLKSLSRAEYTPETVGHYALASEQYCHFTSPIRRYPDLIVHRIMDRALHGQKLKPKEREDLLSYLVEAGKHTSDRERIAMDAEREMVDLKKAQFMMNRIGEEFTGCISSLANFATC